MSLRIVASALKLENGLVISKPIPARHHDLLHPLWDVLEDKNKVHPPGCVQGFLTNEGVFVDRQEACVIAYRASQVIEKTGGPYELYSEDVW